MSLAKSDENRYLVISLALLLFLVCFSIELLGQGSNRKAKLLFVNNLDSTRVNEIVVCKRERLSTFLKSEKEQPQWKTNQSKLITQYDDLDGDGHWDELAILIPKMAAKSSLTIEMDDKPLSKVRSITHARFAKSILRDEHYIPVNNDLIPSNLKDATTPWLYQMEGPSFENDRIAFRFPLASINTKSVLGKLTKKLILDSLSSDVDLSKLNAWGMELLDLGQSIGLGGLALYPFENPDSTNLSQITQVKEVRCQVIADGPIRSIIRFDYQGVKINKGEVNLIETLILPAYSYGYESRVQITNPRGNPTSIGLATGLLGTRNRVAYDSEWYNGFHLLATHDNQAKNGSGLGLAILVTQSSYLKSQAYKKSGSFENSHLIQLKTDNGNYRFHCFAGWEDSNAQFKNWLGWQNFLRMESAKLAHPISIEVKY